ncbi:anion permease [Erwiniaceae bacterium BAC15a-03b]|uniref:Anion permease n=2 Tax=Winslowiella arboricola TaxID=2978220 RepID=A0A9J6PFB8_9GAMM|nr:anion permease [Winslowiella arboricola]MCU5777001.1 anion permease [Winslowiella arboricola]
MLLPALVAIILLLVPVPAGLEPYAWHFFAIFVGVIVGLIIEPLPGAVIGLTAVVIIALGGQWLLFSPEQLAAPGFKLASQSFKWAVSGFGNSTVWLIFGAFMFAAGYDKTRFGRRLALILVKYLGRRSLTLGYAITFADLLLAPFTPSNTARSGGTIYPIIANLPPLYGSKPNDPSARKIGSYLMWVAITATCINSSLFLSALAPNLLALALVKTTVGINIAWGSWFIAFLPVGALLLLTMPLLAYWLYPPQVKINDEVPRWAQQELEKLGKLSRNEILLLLFVCCALMMWIFAASWIEPALAAVLVITLMLWTGVLEWNDITSNKPAWNTFVWFATLVALADGLSSTGFISWLGKEGGVLMSGISPDQATIVLLLAYYLLHYLFASTTAHTTALLPAMLTIAATIPGMNMMVFCLMLVTSQGVMGIITPYGTGPSPIYYGSGYLPTADYWRLGSIFGAIFLAALIVIGYPWMTMMFG